MVHFMITGTRAPHRFNESNILLNTHICDYSGLFLLTEFIRHLLGLKMFLIHLDNSSCEPEILTVNDVRILMTALAVKLLPQDLKHLHLELLRGHWLLFDALGMTLATLAFKTVLGDVMPALCRMKIVEWVHLEA